MAMMSKIFDSMHPSVDKAAKDKKKELNKLKRSAFMDKVNLFRDKHYDVKNAQSTRVNEGEIFDKQNPIENIRVQDSTAIQDAKYNEKTGNMSIKFRGGHKTYVYPGVSEDEADEFKHANSKGRKFNEIIKPHSINA